MWNQKITQQPLGDFSLGFYRLEIKELLGALAHDHTTHRRTHIPGDVGILGFNSFKHKLVHAVANLGRDLTRLDTLEQGQHSLRARMLLMITSTHLSGSALRLP